MRRSRSDPSRSRISAGTPGGDYLLRSPQDQWSALLAMHAEAVARSVALPALPWSSQDWTVLPPAPEVLIAGTVDELDAMAGVAELAERAGSTGTLVYGWPAVVVLDRTRQVVCTPLLTVDLAPAGDGRYTATNQPRFNEGLLTALGTSPDVAAKARRLGGTLPSGDPVAMATGIAALCRVLELDSATLLPPGEGSRLRPSDRGVRNSAVVQVAPPAHATRVLLTELHALRDRRDWAGTSAARLVAPARPGCDVEPELPMGTRSVTVTASLNPSQEFALRAAAALPVTVVVGPPGTGKSELLAAVVADCAVAGESVLVSSTNNHAVDVAVDRAARANTALLVRTGSQEMREQLPVVLRGIAGRPEAAAETLLPARARYAQAEARLAAALEQLHERSAADQDMTARVVARARAVQDLWQDAPVPRRLGDEQTAQIRRAAASRWRPRRRTRRALALAGIDVPDAPRGQLRRWLDAEQALNDAHRRVDSLPADGADGDLHRLELALEDRAAAGQDLAVRAAAVRASRHRAAIEQLAALRRDAGSRARPTATARAVPAVGWACTALAAGGNFPLQAGLFDVLVIDEAAQCHIAHVLPLAYRAKRIVVVGDPNQLTPVQTLGDGDISAACAAGRRTKEQAEQDNISPHADSAYTAYAVRADAQVLLREHYRCHPALAAWLNRAFYSDQLHVLTPPGRLRGPVQGLHWRTVTGRVERDDTGSVLNPAEAAAVVDCLGRLLPQLDDRRDGAAPITVGIVTPFAAQARLIEDHLQRLLDSDTRTALRLTVGTAHRLQGDERDLVLLSPVLSAGVEERTAAWVERERNLLNVAASRARSGLLVVGDDQMARSGMTPTLALLADAAQGRLPAPVVPEGDLHSDAETALHAALTRAGIPVLAKPVIGGCELDFAVFDENGRSGLDVEVDGTHHTDTTTGRQRRQDLARDAVLRGAGWSVLRLPAWLATHEPERAVDAVLRALEQRADDRTAVAAG